MPITKENIVVVRVWKSRNVFQGEVGHVSLDIPFLDDTYVSLYPKDTKHLRTIKPTIIPHRFATLSEDLSEESPDITCRFFSLDINAMHQLIKTKKEKLIGWMLSAETSSVAAHTDNCSSIVYKILQAGGMNDIYNPFYLLTSSYSQFTWTPNGLGKYLQEAVTAERSRYPLTIEYEKFFLTNYVVPNKHPHDPGRQYLSGGLFNAPPSQLTHRSTSAHTMHSEHPQQPTQISYPLEENSGNLCDCVTNLLKRVFNR